MHSKYPLSFADLNNKKLEKQLQKGCDSNHASFSHYLNCKNLDKKSIYKKGAVNYVKQALTYKYPTK